MTTPTTPDNQLTALEETANTAILTALIPATTRALRPMPTAEQAALTAALVADALTDARTPITAAATTAVTDALTLGATTARTQAPPPDSDTTPTTPTADTTRSLTADITIAAGIAYILDDATRTTRTIDPRTLPSHISHTTHRLWRETVTAIHRAANRGRIWYARLFGHNLVWVAEPDYRVCTECAPMDGTIVNATDLFTVNTVDPDFNQHPPAHHMCRCHIEVRPRT